MPSIRNHFLVGRRVRAACLAAAVLLGAPGLLLPPASARAAPPLQRGELLWCRVVGIADGDTLEALCPAGSLRVRLASIDAPELKQPFGRRSKQSLSELVHGKHVGLTVVDTDRYGRLVAEVRADGRSANAEQVRRGMAWVYRKYSDDAALLALEAEARNARRGLWADPDPVAPWEWRH